MRWVTTVHKDYRSPIGWQEQTGFNKLDRMSLNAIIFDMDGVLCDSEPFMCQAGVALFQERFQLHVTPEDFVPFFGAGDDRYIGGVAEKYGVKANLPADKDRLYALYLQIIHGQLKPLPGVAEFIHAARQRGLKLAVGTSADRIKLEGNLRELSLPLETFDVIVTGSQVARKKPHPDLYLQAVKELGLSPSQCLVIEDAPSGLEAARSAGCFALGMTSSFSQAVLRQAGAQWIAPDLNHVPDEVWTLS